MNHVLKPWQLFLLILAGWINRHQQEVIQYLEAENRLLREKSGKWNIPLAGKRILLNDDQRRRLAVKGKVLGRKALQQIATIVTPDTIRWHRELIAAKWDYSKRRKNMERPPVSQEVVDLVLVMARENPSWDYNRIHGALANPGHQVSDATVGSILRNHGIDPAPDRRRRTTWKSFLKAQLFSEELGLVVECLPENENRILAPLAQYSVPFRHLGRTGIERRFVIRRGAETLLDVDTPELLSWWEETSDRIEQLQMNPDCAIEQAGAHDRPGPAYGLSFEPEPTAPALLNREEKPRVAIIRKEGSNWDREMTSAFYAAGFETWDLTMSDLLSGSAALDRYRGVVFVGAFSYADVLDSAKGWAGIIRFNTRLRDMFEAFYRRADTFSLGICNGGQLLALLGWVPWAGVPDVRQPRFIRNASGRFESRWATVRISASPAIMLRGMAGSRLGIWVAHGEGRLHFPDTDIQRMVLERHLAPVQFVDDRGRPTEAYPFNPNGSPGGITGLCSPDGRHLVMMPHPERAFLKWQ